MRTYANTARNFDKVVRPVFGTPKVCVHTYDSLDHNTKTWHRAQRNAALLESTPDAVARAVVSTYHPYAYTVQRAADLDLARVLPERAGALFPQWLPGQEMSGQVFYNIYRSLAAVHRSCGPERTRSPLVIRTRPDLLLDGPKLRVGVQQVASWLVNHRGEEGGNLVLAGCVHKRVNGGDVKDLMFVTTLEVMDLIADDMDVFAVIDEIRAEDQKTAAEQQKKEGAPAKRRVSAVVINPEKIFFHWLHSRGVTILPLQWNVGKIKKPGANVDSEAPFCLQDRIEAN